MDNNVVIKMIKKIADNIWKLNVDSNIYLILDQLAVIDTGPESYKAEVHANLGKIIDIKKIRRVIFTHLHYDHIGNFDLFQNAEFFASSQEIKSLKEDKISAILDPALASRFRISLKPISDFGGFKVLNAPGHTRGSICLYYEKEKMLFSGDTLFYHGIGRTDLPTSDESRMEETLDRLKKLNYKILCPGHDY